MSLDINGYLQYRLTVAKKRKNLSEIIYMMVIRVINLLFSPE
jgi:hypothetical protein